MEKKMFVGVLYITIFVTFCFILLTAFLQYRLALYKNSPDTPETKENGYTILTEIPTPTDIPIIWNTYLNRDDGFSIDYPTNRTANEHVTEGYHLVDFYDGCMQITSGSAEHLAKIKDKNTFPFSNAVELTSLENGQSKSIIYETWDLGGGKKFNLTYTYKKVDPRNIGGIPWQSFLVLSNYENHGTLMQYYIENNGKIYFISSLTSGPCWTKEPQKMLDSFKFINSQ